MGLIEGRLKKDIIEALKKTMGFDLFSLDLLLMEYSHLLLDDFTDIHHDKLAQLTDRKLIAAILEIEEMIKSDTAFVRGRKAFSVFYLENLILARKQHEVYSSAVDLMDKHEVYHSIYRQVHPQDPRHQSISKKTGRPG